MQGCHETTSACPAVAEGSCAGEAARTGARPGLLAVPKLLAQLVKLGPTAAVTLTSIAGFLLHARRPSAGMVTVAAGTMLTVAAASALNQVQESGLDARMARTRDRPIPSGRLERGTALGVVLLAAAAGFALLLSLPTRSLAPAGLAALAFAGYNGVYTPLKRVTVWAVLPGAMIGAIPPFIGWVAAGGGLGDAPAWGVALYFFSWQLPHVGLVLQRHADDWRHAGLPLLVDRFPPRRVRVATFGGILAIAAGAPFVVATMPALPWACTVTVGAASAVLVARGARLLGRSPGERALRDAFHALNAHALVFTLALIACSVA